MNPFIIKLSNQNEISIFLFIEDFSVTEENLTNRDLLR
jgi:hypothetical protein